MSMFNLNEDVCGVSQKIRAAIKTKLMELGVCVEDELPDYIMVMIANKKTKEQITEDLTLFLGNNTEKFTSWLSDLLHRLQSVTLDGSSTIKTEKNVKKTTELFTPSSSLQTHVIDDKIKSESSSNQKVVRISSSLKGPDAITSTIFDQEDILALKDELEDDLFEEEPKVENSNNKEILSKVHVRAPMREQKVEPIFGITKPATDVHKRIKVVHVRPETQAIERKKGPLSTVGAVLQNPIEEEPEYDIKNPITGKVASIVKVSERKSSVPVSQQASKKLLFKAMQEAQHSVAEKLNQQKRSNVMPVQPFSGSVKSRLGATVPKEGITPTFIGMVPDNDINMVDVEFDINTKVTQPAPDVVTIDPNQSPVTERIILPTAKHKRITFGSNESTQENLVRSSTFIITLDGVDESSFRDKNRKRSHAKISSYEDEVDEIDEHDEEIDYDSEASDYEVYEKKSKLPEKCKFWPSCKNADDCEYHHPVTNCKLFPKCKFGDKCLYIHPQCKYDSKCSKESCPFMHSSKRDFTETPQSTDSQSSTSEVMCKFFPNCTKSNCPFKHIKPCRWGYSCKRSDCSFSHPTLPTPDKLKWSAANKMDTMESTIIGSV